MSKGYRGNALAVGRFRSGLESNNATLLERKGISFRYEELFLPYVIPASNHKYTPDFVLKNGIIVETKGIFDSDDRKKHLLIREQYPELDIRFVFSSSRSKIYKGSKTSLAEWCENTGFKFADKLIPLTWLKEKQTVNPELVLKEHKRGKK